MSNQTHQIDEKSLFIRAAFSPSTLSEEERTVQVIFGTDKPVPMSIMGERVSEVLSFQPGHVRLERLNGGAPLLDNHNISGPVMETVLGVVERAWVDGKNGFALVRFAKTEKADKVMAQVKDKVIRNVSVGYMVHKYMQKTERASGSTRTYFAVDWEPHEISLVSVPADAGAVIRSLQNVEIEVEADENEEKLNQRGLQLRATLALYPNT